MLIHKIKHSKYSHFLSLSIFIVLLLWFKYLKMTIVPKYIIFNKLDGYIPFVKEFIIPYYFWFLYMAIGFLYLGINSKKDFFRMYIFIVCSMSIAYIIFMLFPNGQFPRPIITQRDIFSRLVKFIYTIDATNNVCPSIHVSNAIGVHIALVNCYKLKNKRFIKVVSLVGMILICASTVFVKQHSILDVIAGIALASILYILIYHAPKLYAKVMVKNKYANNN